MFVSETFPSKSSLLNCWSSTFRFFTALCLSRIWSRMSTGRWQSRSLLHWQCWTFDPEWILGQWSLCTHQYSRFCWIGSASVPSRVFKSLGNCDCNHRWHWIHWCCRGTLIGRSHSCKSSTENCTLDVEAKTVNCRGKALNLTEQCHGQDPSIPVCNHYGSDERRNGDAFKGAKRSHINICNDNR